MKTCGVMNNPALLKLFSAESAEPANIIENVIFLEKGNRRQ